MYYPVSNFSKKKKEEEKSIFIKKLMEKSELLVQIAKVSRQKIKIADRKYITFSLQRLAKKEDKNDNYWFC